MEDNTLLEMNYTMWDPAAQPGGGFSDIGPEKAPGDVLIYVDSEDIEADLKRVEELGGKTVTLKTEIPGMGWFGLQGSCWKQASAIYEQGS